MNWLDVLLAVILGVSAIAGLVKGLARSVIGLAAVVLGVLCALWFHEPAASMIQNLIASRRAAEVAGFLAIFLGVIVLGQLVAAALTRIFKWVHLSWLDRLLGGVLGALRGTLICAGIVLLIMSFADASPPASVAESTLARPVVDVARVIVEAAPDELKETFKRNYERLKKLWREPPGLRAGIHAGLYADDQR